MSLQWKHCPILRHSATVASVSLRVMMGLLTDPTDEPVLLAIVGAGADGAL
jgi:hypothetical protein